MGEELMKRAQRAGQKHVREITKKLNAHGLKPKTFFVTGDPADEILKAEKRMKPDLIVVGGAVGPKAHCYRWGALPEKSHAMQNAPCLLSDLRGNLHAQHAFPRTIRSLTLNGSFTETTPSHIYIASTH